ncbi:lytic murein transglycosylase, partial [Burkholderia sp. E168m23]
MMSIVCREFAANLPQRGPASARGAGCVGYTAPNTIALSARFDMNSSKPAALLSALFRVRAPLVVAAIAAALGTAPAVAQTQPAKPAGTLVAQAQPQQPTPQGQTFEEEIVPQRYASNAKVDAFIDEMVSRNGFDSASLHALFSRISYSATAVKLVRPAPTPSVKNWRVYRSRFIEPIRINAGVKF